MKKIFSLLISLLIVLLSCSETEDIGFPQNPSESSSSSSQSGSSVLITNTIHIYANVNLEGTIEWDDISSSTTNVDRNSIKTGGGQLWIGGLTFWFDKRTYLTFDLNSILNPESILNATFKIYFSSQMNNPFTLFSDFGLRFYEVNYGDSLDIEDYGISGNAIFTFTAFNAGYNSVNITPLISIGKSRIQFLLMFINTIIKPDLAYLYFNSSHEAFKPYIEVTYTKYQ